MDLQEKRTRPSSLASSLLGFLIISNLGMKSNKQIMAMNLTIILKSTNFSKIFARVKAFNFKANGQERSILGNSIRDELECS